MIIQLAKLLAALNSESSPRQLALAITLGMVMGLTPTLSMHNGLVLLAVCVLRVNVSGFLLAYAVFSGIAMLTVGLFSSLGAWCLEHPYLWSMWNYGYQFVWFQLANLHHTVTCGALLVSLVALLPVYFLSKWLVITYRDIFQAFVEKFKVVQALKSSRFYQYYQNYIS